MKLPPLNAIKAFEATVRCSSFTAAANELGVSSAAVSLQVAKAETFLGKKLFVRGNNTLTLTDAGQMLYPHVAQSLSQLSDITEQFLEQDMRSRLVVSTIQTLAERWVVPALAQFRKMHPKIGMALQIDADPFDFNRNPFDLRVSYHPPQDTGFESQQIAQDYVIPVCTPRFADVLDNVSDRELIHIDWGEAYTSYPTWAAWFRHLETARSPDAAKGLRAPGTGVGLQLAAAGAGVVLAPMQLAKSDIAQGRLIQLGAEKMRLPFGYYVTRGHAKPNLLTSAPKQRYITDLVQCLRDQNAKS